MGSTASRPSVTIRVATPDDDPAIAALISEGAPGNPKADLQVLRWQYRREVFGPTVSVVAEAAGEIVGHYGVVGVPLHVDGRPVRAGRGVDIVTAPAFRGQGVFGEVTRRLVEVAAGAGYEAIVSTPNDNSLPVLLRHGWSSVGDPRARVALVDGASLAGWVPVPLPSAIGRLVVSVLGVARRRSPLVARSVDGVPADLDQLASTATSHTGIARVVDWWRWRYHDHPHRPYLFFEVRTDRLVGFAVMSLREDADGRFVQILDLVAVDPDSTRALVAAAGDLARAEKAVGVVAAAFPGSDHDQSLRTAGMLSVPRRLQPRPIHLLVADLSGERPELASRPWTFSLGDQDHL